MTSQDSKWSRIVRKRSRNKCEVGLLGCGIIALHGMHVIPRRYQELRYDADNGVAGCAYCHDACDQNRNRVNLVEILSRIAPDRFENLRIKLKKFYNIDIENLI